MPNMCSITAMGSYWPFDNRVNCPRRYPHARGGEVRLFTQDADGRPRFWPEFAIKSWLLCQR